MDRQITIRDYLKQRTNIMIPDFENVLSISCLVFSGDEVLFITYNDGSEKVFDSSNNRIMDYFDGSSLIYLSEVKDVIDAFSKSKTSYDNLKLFG